MILVLIMVCCCQPLLSQVPTGIPAFGSFQDDGFDTVDLANLNAQFAVPIFTRPGRGAFNFSYIMTYDSSVWYPTGAAGNQTWTNDQNWGWKGQTQVATGYLPEKTIAEQCLVSGHFIPFNSYHFSTYIDSFGIHHDFLPPNVGVTLFKSACSSKTQATVQAA